jgi:toxin ParE1/3/4
MAKVTLTEQAQAELAEIITNVTREVGINAARNFRSSFFEFFQHIAAFPEACEARPKLGRGIRLGIVYPYSVFYRYQESHAHVSVLRILRGRRRITRTMLRET